VHGSVVAATAITFGALNSVTVSTASPSGTPSQSPSSSPTGNRRRLRGSSVKR
jgi:hypothetical protein